LSIIIILLLIIIIILKIYPPIIATNGVLGVSRVREITSNSRFKSNPDTLTGIVKLTSELLKI